MAEDFQSDVSSQYSSKLSTGLDIGEQVGSSPPNSRMGGGETPNLNDSGISKNHYQKMNGVKKSYAPDSVYDVHAFVGDQSCMQNIE